MVFIDAYIQSRVDAGEKTKDIANDLNLTSAMVGQYRLKRGYNPSLTVAKLVYEKYAIALHPFSAESLQYEIKENNVR